MYSERTYSTKFIFAVASILALLAGVYAANSLLIGHDDPNGLIGTFWVSGWAQNHHLNPYAVYPLTRHSYVRLNNDGGSFLFNDINLSPPCMLPLFQLLSLIPIRTVIILWTAISEICLLGGTWLLLAALGERMQRRQIIWLLLSYSAFGSLEMGHFYLMLYFMVCLIWYLFHRGREIWAAIALGILIAFKPNLGLWPLFLFASGYKRIALASTVVAVAISSVAAAIYGPAVYIEWFQANSLIPHHLLPADISLIGTFWRFGHPLLGDVLARARPWRFSSSLFELVHPLPFLAASLSARVFSARRWGGINYSLFAAPFFVAFRRWGPLETCAALLLTMPYVGDIVIVRNGPWLEFALSAPHLAGLMLMLWSFLRNARPHVENMPGTPPFRALCEEPA